jgi:hypothetical protein
VVVVVFCRGFWKLWLRNVVFWHGKPGVDRGECVAGNTTNFATKNTPRFLNLFLDVSCRMGYLRGRRSLRDGHTGFAPGLPMVEKDF